MDNGAKRSFRALRLAVGNRARWLAAFASLEREATSKQVGARLRAITHLLKYRAVSINMSIPALERFLKDGVWLNTYEAAAAEARALRVGFRTKLRERLGRFYGPRRLLDRALGLGVRSHYAAANFGGTGPTRYGDCCVVFNVDRWVDELVTFPGDSILSCFDKDGRLVRSQEELREALAVIEDMDKQAVLHKPNFVLQQAAGVSLADVRGIFEAPTEMIEVYLNGPVTADDIERVAMAKGRIDVLWELSLDAHTMTGVLPEKYDLVGPFLRVKEQLDARQIPLVEAEP